MKQRENVSLSMSQAPWSLRPYTLLDCFLWDLTQDDLSAVSPRLSDDTENTNPLRYSEVSKALNQVVCSPCWVAPLPMKGPTAQ